LLDAITASPLNELEETAKAAAIVRLMAANFEHMWFYLLAEAVPPQDASDLALISGLASRATSDTFRLRGPDSGA